LEDGSSNRYRIVRLKDKLGTRSMASGEIVLEGALAYAVGRLDRGFVQMAEMVNWSRLSNGVKSTALMRRALHDALTVARGRMAFGRRIADLPLARRQILKMMVPMEQALSLCFATADALDRAEAGHDRDAAALVRMLTPVLKFRATRDARKVCGDALEMRGGAGYIKKAFQDVVAPELHALRGEIRVLDQKIIALDQKIDAVESRLTIRIDALAAQIASHKAELLAEIRRVDNRIDSLDREVRTAIDVRERLAA